MQPLAEEIIATPTTSLGGLRAKALVALWEALPASASHQGGFEFLDASRSLFEAVAGMTSLLPLLRELEAITEEPGQGWAAGMAELLMDAKLVADRARAAGLQRVDDQARARLQGRYQRLLADGRAANPPPRTARRGRGRRSPAARLLARLDAHRDEVLRSLEDSRVPFDNNQGERDLRMVKLQQKISGCWRTLAGAEAFLALRSYVATARKHGVNPLVVLRQLFAGHPWLPAPAPGPLPAPP